MSKTEQIEELPLEQAEKEKKPEEQKELPRYFKEGNAWFRRGDDDSAQILTNFHLELKKIVKKYDYENRRWERSFDVQFHYDYEGRKVTSPIIELLPKQTGVPTEFSNAIWDVDFRSCYIQNPISLKAFITHLYHEQKPKEVRVYDYFGFININREPYYLCKNALIKLSRQYGEPSMFIAPDQDGVFKVSDDLHVTIDPHLEGIPWLENLGVGEDGMYKDPIFDNPYYERNKYMVAFQEIEEHLQEMVSGQQAETKPEGSLILGYVFSHLIFDEIFTTFNHVVYLYLYGKGNTGKNSLIEIIRIFFGLPFAASPNPTLSALETLLGTHSKIPLWMDEFIPENTPGKQNHIKDQFWNSYFQLIHRPVSSRNRYKTAAPKPVRASVLFSSNYLPKSDHFNSRTLKIEYRLDKRGAEHHYRWLQNNRSDLQYMFMAALDESKRMNSKFIKKELFYLKKRLYEVCKSKLSELKEREGAVYTLHDRQVEQFAALYLSYNLFSGQSYYQELENYHNEQDSKVADTLREMIDMNEDQRLFKYCVQAIVKHSLEEAEKDALTEFLDVISDLVRSPGNPNHIQLEHEFHWAGEDLLIFWSKVWNRYVKQVGPAEAVQVKTQIEKSMNALDSKGGRHNVNWTDKKTTGKTVRGKGYRIMNAAQDPRFALAFEYPDMKSIEHNAGETTENDESTPF